MKIKKCEACDKPRLEKLLYCQEHLSAEYERFFESDAALTKQKEVSHTPTPWSWNVHYIVQGLDPNANGARIVMPLYKPTVRSKYEGRADAEFIVRAVNSHDALLGAAKKAEEFISWFRNMAIENQITVQSYAERFKPSDFNAIDAIRKAIAQAEGKKVT